MQCALVYTRDASMPASASRGRFRDRARMFFVSVLCGKQCSRTGRLGDRVDGGAGPGMPNRPRGSTIRHRPLVRTGRASWPRWQSEGAISRRPRNRSTFASEPVSRGFGGSLSVRSADVTSGAREVKGTSCEEVVEALAVVTAIALNEKTTVASSTEPASVAPVGAPSVADAGPAPQPPRVVRPPPLHAVTTLGRKNIAVQAGTRPARLSLRDRWIRGRGARLDSRRSHATHRRDCGASQLRHVAERRDPLARDDCAISMELVAQSKLS